MLLPAEFKVWLSSKPTDMRKAINGLSNIVVDKFNTNPQTGELFIFYNRKKDLIKILYWHYNGFCLFNKRLEKSSFKIPSKLSKTIIISKNQLGRLIEGLHFINKGDDNYDIFC